MTLRCIKTNAPCITPRQCEDNGCGLAIAEAKRHFHKPETRADAQRLYGAMICPETMGPCEQIGACETNGACSKRWGRLAAETRADAQRPRMPAEFAAVAEACDDPLLDALRQARDDARAGPRFCPQDGAPCSVHTVTREPCEGCDAVDASETAVGERQPDLPPTAEPQPVSPRVPTGVEFEDQRILAIAAGGNKDDAGKLPMHLIAPELLTEVAAVLQFGAEKYGARNWERGMDWSRAWSAAQRHMWAWMAGEDRDDETALSHVAHAACCLMFLLAYQSRGTGRDDRPGGEVAK